jgi:hypothetical protein
MAIQILPSGQRNRVGLGTALGTGIGQGIQQIAQNRLQDILQSQQQQKTVTGLSALGFSPEEAQAFSLLPEGSLNEIIKSRLEEPSKIAFAQGLSSIAKTPSPALEEKPTPYPMQADVLEEDSVALGDKDTGERDIAIPGKVETKAQALPVLDEKRAFQLMKLQLSKDKIVADQKKEFRRESIHRQENIDKETKDFYKELTKQADTAKENNRKLSKLEQLVRYGRLGGPLANSLLKSLAKGVRGYGMDLTFLMTPDAQNFDKLSTDFVRGAREIFGARLTDSHMRAFLKTIPSLMQTREGMMRVITNFRSTNDIKILKKKAMTEIIKENNGRRPSNLDSLIDERVSPVIDQWVEEIKDTEPVTFGSGGSFYQLAKALRLVY